MDPGMTIRDRRFSGPFLDFGWHGRLYPYQSQAARQVHASAGGLVIAPPSAGKTEMGLALCAAWGSRALWIVHTRPLATQALRRAMGLFHLPRTAFGQVGGGHGRDAWGTHLTVATVQSLARHRWPEEESIGTVIWDECHHLRGITYARVLFHRLAARHLVGLTANPCEGDIYPLLDALLGPRVVVDYGHLVEIGRALLPDIDVIPTQFRGSPRADWNATQAERAQNPRRNRLICATAAVDYLSGMRPIVLVERVEHTKVIAAMLSSEFGVPAAAVSGPVSSYARNRAFGALLKERQVLVATKLMDEGVDLPLADSLTLGAAQRSESLQWQRIGRVIRAPAGKTRAVVHDLADLLVPALADQFRDRLAMYERLKFTVRMRRPGAVA